MNRSIALAAHEHAAVAPKNVQEGRAVGPTLKDKFLARLSHVLLHEDAPQRRACIAESPAPSNLHNLKQLMQFFLKR